MYICIAALTDSVTQNNARKIAFDLSTNYDIGTLSARLPLHISLKQSFKVKSIEELEEYFDNFTCSLSPFYVKIEKTELLSMEDEFKTTQILWYKMVDSAELRNLHERLNSELYEHFGIQKQGFDGENWKFHSTIAYDINKENVFNKYLAENDLSVSSKLVKIDKLAIFFSPNDKLTPGDFITYKINNL